MPSAILHELNCFGPDQCPKLDYEQAADYTRRLTRAHSENFTVVSWLLPRRLREDFQHVYAFCRWADDLGDEIRDPARSRELLDWWRRELNDCYEDRPRHPVFVALHRTIRRHDVPRQPFDDLIDAFIQDQEIFRYDTWDQVLGYCTRSANPVGQLVLYLCGHRDDQRRRLSDSTCTALQLANFWQDVRRDVLERDRVYVPRRIAEQHGLDLDLMVKVIQADEADDAGPRCAACPASAGITAWLPSYRATIRDLVARTWPLFQEGRQLWPLVHREVRADIELFTRGGESILKMIQRLDHNTLESRPALSKGAKMGLMLRALLGRCRPMGKVS